MKANIKKHATTVALGLALSLSAAGVAAFNSGSTGVDGPFNPTADTVLVLPASGTFNFTSVNIPAGVTVRFQRNATNTPVTMLVSGDFVLAGTIDVSGSSGAQTSSNDVDSGQPGLGGPGGYSGGRGGLIAGAASRTGGAGLGPGGGSGGDLMRSDMPENNQGGGGGGFAVSVGQLTPGFSIYHTAPGGPAYGSNFLLPLIGGSGGGGGRGGTVIGGSGGGGGGGAIAIAVSGTVDIQAGGRILANGGNGGDLSATGLTSVSLEAGGCGGGGSGGAIRIVATVVKGSGQLKAEGGLSGASCVNGTSNNPQSGTAGGVGRIRIEGEKMVYGNSSNSPLPSYDTLAGPAFVPSQPSLRITNVAGASAPSAPTGNRDLDLPTTTTNPVTVDFASNGIPLGTTISLTVKPTFGAAVTATSSPLAGTVESATANASVSLPPGHSVLTAAVSYTITASLGDALGGQYANGERVERIEVSTATTGLSTTTLVTVSGKRFPMPGLPATPGIVPTRG